MPTEPGVTRKLFIPAQPFTVKSENNLSCRGQPHRREINARNNIDPVLDVARLGRQSFIYIKTY